MKTGVSSSLLPLLLATALVPGIGCSVVCDFTRSDVARLDLRSIGAALKLHYGKLGRYPSTEEGLQALVDHGMLDHVPRDPWGNRYRYALRSGEIELRSLGADGGQGGSGEDADIDLRDVLPTMGAGR